MEIKSNATGTAVSVTELPVPVSAQKRIAASISNYAAAGIDITIAERSNDSITVVIEQARLINGYILNNKQLYDRAKEVFMGTVLKVKIKPAVYTLQVDKINVRWVEGKMEEFGINRNDLIKQLALDKASLSLMLSGTRELTKPARAMFFYYFLTYELNRDFREI